MPRKDVVDAALIVMNDTVLDLGLVVEKIDEPGFYRTGAGDCLYAWMVQLSIDHQDLGAQFCKCISSIEQDLGRSGPVVDAGKQGTL